MQPKILFLDNHLLALDKPAGILTQPNDAGDLSLEQWGKQWLKKEFNKPGNVFLHAIHRLDRPVSGIVLFARTSKALSRLNQAQRERKIEKVYTAWIHGHLRHEKGVLKHRISHGSHRALIEEEGKEAELSYCVLKEGQEATLVEIQLHTGRYHQIRAQFSEIGHPILGDDRYGGTPATRLYLHHTKMTFLHPITREKIEIVSPLDTAWNI